MFNGKNFRTGSGIRMPQESIGVRICLKIWYIAVKMLRLAAKRFKDIRGPQTGDSLRSV